jgi:MFS family permease
MENRHPFHRQLFERLRAVGEGLTGREAVEPLVQVVGRGAEVVEQQVERGVEAVVETVGGWARARVVVLLAAVLALSSADTGAISAIAPKLETSLHIGNVDIGLLVTVSGLTAAAGMLPVGWVTDRWNRTRLVKIAVAIWGIAEILSAMAPDYTFLLVVRLALGALTAVTGPCLASLTGDLFPARERSQIYGYILTGELIGAGLGLLIAGLVSAWATWRVAVAVLALPSFALSWQLHRRLPEPARGGQSRLERGAEEIVGAEALAQSPPDAGGPGAPSPAEPQPTRRDESPVIAEVRRRKVDARQGTVLDRDPLALGWWESVRYVVAVPSNVTLIVGSALGYFFFGGVETFALIFLEGHFHVGQAPATLVALGVGAAAVGGAVLGGRVTDLELRRGHLEARLLVPAAAFLLVALVFLPAVLSTALIVSLPLFLVAGFCIAAPNPGLDAARLDIMPSRMWGRAEAVRSFLRAILQSFAPLVFGLVSTEFGGRQAGFGAAGGGVHSHQQSAGLEPTFVIMLATVLAAAFIVWRGSRHYATDIAAADATERRFPAGASNPHRDRRPPGRPLLDQASTRNRRNPQSTPGSPHAHRPTLGSPPTLRPEGPPAAGGS